MHRPRDLVWLLLIAAYAFAVAGVAAVKDPFYFIDDCLTAIVFEAPSFGAMMAACADFINNTMPAYWVASWPWVKLFGTSDMSLRCLSALYAAAATGGIFALLRRIMPAPAAGLLATSLLYGSVAWTRLASEARFYTFFAMAFVWCIDRCTRLYRERTDSRSLLVTFFAFCTLTHAHLYGIAYGCILLTLTLAVRGPRAALSFRDRLRFCVFGAAGLATISLWLPTILLYLEIGASMRVPAVGLPNLLRTALALLPLPGSSVLGRSSNPLLFPALFAALAAGCTATAAIAFARFRARSQPDRSPVGRLPAPETHFLIAHGAVCAALPALFWLAHVARGIPFGERYLLPASAGILLGIGAALTAAGRHPRLSTLRAFSHTKTFAVIAMFFALGAGGLTVARKVARLGVRPAFADFIGRFPTDAIVLCEDLPNAIVLGRASRNRPRFVYFPDPAFWHGRDERSWEPVQTVIALALERHFRAPAVGSPELLEHAANSPFFAINREGNPWFDHWIASRTDLTPRVLATLPAAAFIGNGTVIALAPARAGAP